MGAVLVLGLIAAIEPVRLGIAVFLMSPPRPLAFTDAGQLTTIAANSSGPKFAHQFSRRSATSTPAR